MSGSNGIFNIAKGRFIHYASLPNANDAMVAVLLKDPVEADDTLNNYDDLAALLAASNDECDATNYARQTLTSVTVTIDDANNRVDGDCADITFADLGGAVNNTVAKLLTCYDPDTTSGTDSGIIPSSYHSFDLTTDGTEVIATVNNFGRAA